VRVHERRKMNAKPSIRMIAIASRSNEAVRQLSNAFVSSWAKSGQFSNLSQKRPWGESGPTVPANVLSLNE